MDKVKELIRAGADIPEAVRIALRPMTITGFAEKHRLNRASVSNEINGNVRASDATLAALAAQMGGTSEHWRELLAVARTVDYGWARTRLAEMVTA